MIGDGYHIVVHCEFADDVFDVEPDASPVLCKPEVNPVEPGMAYYTGQGGYVLDRKRADRILEGGKAYKVSKARVGSWMTMLTLEGIEGKWNSAMFEWNEEGVPKDNSYDL